MGGAQIRVERFKYRNLNQVVCTLPPPINGGAALLGNARENPERGWSPEALKAR